MRFRQDWSEGGARIQFTNWSTRGTAPRTAQTHGAQIGRGPVAFLLVCLVLLAGPTAQAATEAASGPVMDAPTLRSLGAYWLVADTDEKPASVNSEFRREGTQEWKPGAPFIRCRKGPFKGENGQPKPQLVTPPEDSHMFAGSLLLLEPDTAYEWRLTLHASDGRTVVKTLTGRTIAEPVVSATAPRKHVIEGNGGGEGTKENPYRGLEAADKAAAPGDVMLVHAGTYPKIVLHASGEPGKPIVWQGAGDGETIVDGGDATPVPATYKDPYPHGKVIEAKNLHDVWLEHLTIRNGGLGLWLDESSNIVVQRCHFYHLMHGISGEKNDGAVIHGFFISDNLMEGMFPWPSTDAQWHELPETRAICITGRGHVACYNRITHWKDALDTQDSIETVAVDFHNNDVSEMFDDGSEMDGSDRNCRCFRNRFCDTLTGISTQPVYGGPIYIFRNVLYNIRGEGFKLHNSPAGPMIFHNTIVKFGMCATCSTTETAYNVWDRNNLFVGRGNRAINYDLPLVDCNFDYDGFAGWSGDVFAKWSGVRYATPEEAQKSGQEKHLSLLDPAKLFASGLEAPKADALVFDRTKIDFRLSAASEARGKGEALPWANDGKTGPADLGAVPFGGTEPFYGIRPEKTAH